MGGYVCPRISMSITMARGICRVIVSVPMSELVKKTAYNQMASLMTVPTRPFRTRIRNCFRFGHSNGSTCEKFSRRNIGQRITNVQRPTKPGGGPFGIQD